jgi:kynurenine formamidase
MDLLEQFQAVDLTHPLNPSIPAWDDTCGFQHETIVDYDECPESAAFRVQKLEMPAGIGTHMDAPAHCIPGAKTIEQLSLDQLITQCVVIDVSGECHEHFKVTPKHLKQFEKEYGVIRKNSLVIFHTGWEKYWNDRDRFVNGHVFPSIASDVAEILLERDVAGIGIDTLSPDIMAEEYPVHKLILGANKFIVENIANAKKLPPTGAYSFALPIRFTGGTEAPVRLIALTPNM